MPTKNWTPERLERRRQQMAEHNKKYYAEHKEKCKELVKEWRASHPEKVKEYKRTETLKNLDKSLARVKKWRQENDEYYKEQSNAANKLRYWENPEERRAYTRKYYRENVSAIRDQARQGRWDLKVEVIKAYGGSCACCGDTHFEFLTIDHIKGGGTKHRKESGLEGQSFYIWLKQNNFPKGDYRVLCISCNFSLGHYGYCPHADEMHEEFLA